MTHENREVPPHLAKTRPEEASGMILVIALLAILGIIVLIVT